METLLGLIPWVVLLLVFVGMLALCWKLASGQHDLATLLAQALAKQPPTIVPTLEPSPVTRIPPPVPIPVPEPIKPTGPFADAPPWFQFAVHEIGFKETGNNQGIERYIGLAHTGSLGDPWCAIFVNACLESSGIQGSRSPSSQSFRTNANFIQLSTPAIGCIVVFWRGTQASGLGHVGFYRGEDTNNVWTLGGNESDMVQIEALPKSSSSFGLIGYWWPKSVPLPATGQVMMPAGSPASVQIAPPGAAPTIPVAHTPEFSAMVAGGYFSSAPFDKSIPASIRTNNPGALNVAPWIRTAPGYVGDKVTSMSGAEANSTVIFSTPEYGVAAWFTLLQKYRAAGATTLGAIINRYGGGQDYSNYVGEVAAWSGIGEQTEINLDDDVSLLAFGKAMFRYEAGRLSPLSDAQIVYGFNLARAKSTPAAQPPAVSPSVV